MKHIAILKSGIGSVGGLEKYTLNLANAFATKGFKVSLLTSGNTQKVSLPHPGIQLINLGHFPKFSFYPIWRFDQLCQEWIKKHNPEFVFGMDRNSYQTHYRAGNGVHAEYLERRGPQESLLKRLSFKINPQHQMILNFERKTYENDNLKALFTNSDMVKNEILKHYSTNPEIIYTVHNGVEWNDMQQDFDVWEFNQVETIRELRLNPTCYQFLFAGNGFKRKGLLTLIEALKKLSWSNYQLSIVGNDKDMKDYKSLVHKYHLDEKVKFFGLRKDIRRFYSVADCLVIPSLYDPFANVTVEALAMGLYVISSNSNGGHEVLTPESGTILQNPFNVEELVQHLNTALAHPKTHKRAKAIRQSVKHLDFPNQLNKIVNVVTA
jgi:UDP-glucose:(heptosyl)LPS alpha-1,3-glucosyltransferase